MNARRASLLLSFAAALFVCALPDPEGAEARPRHDGRKKGQDDEIARIERIKTGRCKPQKAQSFLIRSSYMRAGQLVPQRHDRAIRYRTEEYGYVEGFGSPRMNAKHPTDFAEQTSFFGLPLRVHKKMAPALRCVEEELPRACGKNAYHPAAVGGFRDHNTYRGGEVTNHLYGIAIDIDPEKNPCCHCVEPWTEHPACRIDSKSPFEKMEMPACWVHVFEKYGFYWLGHDRLEDTMHFEFLGKPEKVLR